VDVLRGGEVFDCRGGRRRIKERKESKGEEDKVSTKKNEDKGR
jgi:hypothetical protein